MRRVAGQVGLQPLWHVQVDDAALDLRVAQLDRALGVAPIFVAHGQHGPVSQLGHQVIPHNPVPVVVAVHAERLPEPVIPFAVRGGAGHRLAVDADRALTADAAALGLAVGHDASVHDPERRLGEGDEHGRVRHHGFWRAFPVGQASLDPLVGVVAVGGGAGRAQRGDARASRLVEHVVAKCVGGEAFEHGAGRRGHGEDFTAEADGRCGGRRGRRREQAAEAGLGGPVLQPEAFGGGRLVQADRVSQEVPGDRGGSTRPTCGLFRVRLLGECVRNPSLDDHHVAAH